VAIIDTGSPISLVKRELIPNNVNVIKLYFSGINGGTKLDFLGIFETDIFVNDNTFSMCV